MRQGFGLREPPPRLVPEEGAEGGGLLDLGAGAAEGGADERPEDPLPRAEGWLPDDRLPPLPEEPPEVPDFRGSTEGEDPVPLFPELPDAELRSR